jgi:hypothetical protein
VVDGCVWGLWEQAWNTKGGKLGPKQLLALSCYLSRFLDRRRSILDPGNTKEGNIIVTLTSCLTGLELSVLQIKTKIVSCHTADSKSVKQEVNDTVILPSLVFPGSSIPPSIQKA